MDERHPPTSDLEHPLPRQVGQVRVVVAADRFHRRQPAQPFQGLGPAHVAGVEDQLAACQALEDGRRQLIQELRVVGVRDHADAHLSTHCTWESNWQVALTN